MNDKLRVPYALAVFGDEERAAVADVLKTVQIVAGQKASEFERKVADLFGKKFGIFVNSGSSANLLALELLRLPAGSEVITPILTFATTLAPIVQKGLIPAFVDVGIGSYLLNIDQVEAMITPRTRAMLVPSLFGNIPDLPRLQAIAKKHNLYLIEDSCDTLGATIDGQPTGIWSDISTTSFYASHIVTAAGEGGMIMVNRPDWHDQLRMLSGWGRRSSLNETEDINHRLNSKIDGLTYDSKFIFEEVGYNFRTTDIAAAFGLVQLNKFKVFSGIRQQHFAELLKFFAPYTDFFALPEQAANVVTNWLAFPLTIKPNAPFSRADLVKYLENNNIQTRPAFTGNVLRQPGFRNIKRVENFAGYPNADYIMQNSFVVGCHHGLEQKHIDHLMQTFSEFLRAYSSPKVHPGTDYFQVV